MIFRYIPGWWFQPLWKILSSGDDDIPNWMERHNPFMFQTTNQMVTWWSTIENGPVEKVDLAIKNGGSFHSYVSLPEGNHSLIANDCTKPSLVYDSMNHIQIVSIW